MQIKKLLAGFGVTLALCAGCVPIEESKEPDPVPIRPALPAPGGLYSGSGWPIREVVFVSTQNAENTVDIDNLAGHSVYLVKINKGSTSVSARNTGHAYTASASSPNIRAATLPEPVPYSRAVLGGEPVRRDHREAQEYNHRAGLYGQSRTLARPSARAAAASVGNQRSSFWVQDAPQGRWIQIAATVRAQSTHANVWIADESFDSSGSADYEDFLINATQAQALADTFDAIYGFETPLFGFEYGGGYDQTPGGVDGDSRIQILVYDIDYDAANTSKPSLVEGYFWSKDMEAFSTANHSNQAEMFYIDSETVDKHPQHAYSTLVHEFQHMIHYNRKEKIQYKTSATWFDEMMSMLAEDIISPQIGIDEDNGAHPIKSRIPSFLAVYDRAGITNWNTTNPLMSYAISYGFGAYLARNYGGPALIKAIMDNSQVDEAAIANALNSEGSLTGGSPFQDALQRYGEALLFSGSLMPAGANSFDKQASGQADTGITYTFEPFDIWNMENPATGYSGPVVWSLDWQFAMQPYSIIVQSLDEWQDVTGNLRVTVTKPASPTQVKLYLMVR